MYFQAEDRWHGIELWWTDGVASYSGLAPGEGRYGHYGYNAAVVGDHGGAGTRMVLDIQAGVGSSAPSHIVALPGSPVVLFAADDGIHGRELWSSDATAAGTVMVMDIKPGSDGSRPAHLVVFGGIAYFAADDGIHGTELWASDGTASGTKLIADIFTGARGSYPAFLTVFRPDNSADPADDVERVYFTANAVRGLGSAELWLTDGTEEGTTRLFDNTAKDIDLDPRTAEAYPARLTTYNGALYYSANRFHNNLEGSALPSGFQAGRASSVSVVQSVVIEDVDAGAENITVTISCSKGELTLEDAYDLADKHIVYFSDGSDGIDDRIVTFHASVEASNRALRGLIYKGMKNQNGPDRVIITVNDTASTGEFGITHVVTQYVDIVLSAVNDAPVITSPATVEAIISRGYLSSDEAKALIGGNAIRIDDPDLDETHLQSATGRDNLGLVAVRLTLSHGRLSLYCFAKRRKQCIGRSGVHMRRR